jgi:hypothetical protein
MPQDSSTWDLSNLLIDGQPVSRDTVTAWLNVLYMQLEGVHFLGSASVAALTATGLYQLLAFADAVGSIRGVLRACLPKEEVTIRIAVEAIKCTLDASECQAAVQMGVLLYSSSAASHGIIVAGTCAPGSLKWKLYMMKLVCVLSSADGSMSRGTECTATYNPCNSLQLLLLQQAVSHVTTHLLTTHLSDSHM